jgi:hypothetical protein
MAVDALTRRKVAFAAVGGFASLATTTTTAQQKEPSRPLPLAVTGYGARHRETVDRLLQTLGPKVALDSEKGLHLVIRLLVDSGLLTQSEAALLDKIVDAIFSSKSVSAMRDAVVAVKNELVRAASDLAKAITSIVEDSIEFAAKKLSDKDFLKVVAIVSADLGGALSGAFALAGGGIPLAVIGGLVGAVSGSALTASKTL